MNLHRVRRDTCPRDDKTEKVGLSFAILEHVEKVRKAGRNYVTRCPPCAESGHDWSGDNLVILIDDPRFYKCWRAAARN